MKHLSVLVAQVMDEHEMRLDVCEVVPLKRRPHQSRKRPNTALISEAAQAAAQRRMMLNQLRRSPYRNYLAAKSAGMRYSDQPGGAL